MSLACSRPLFLMAFVASALVMSAVLYLEHDVGLMPCSLCLVQRFFMICFGLVCLGAAVHGPQRFGLRVYCAAALVCALAGGASALRQLWLQGNDAFAQVCQPGPSPVLQTLPFAEAMSTLLLGTPECARVTWTLLDMSLPEWSLLAFTGMTVFAMSQWLRRGS